MRHLVALVAALGGCVGLVLAAQAPAPPPQTPQFRAGIDVVQVDVSVLDKDRRPVTGLTQADFVVLENGKPQPIVAFSPVDIPGAPDVVVGDAPWTREVASDVASNEAATKRIVVIVIDDAFIPADPATMKNAKQIARAVVGQLGPNDLAAVAYTLYGRAQDVTTDHQRLLAAIDQLVGHGDGPSRPMSAGFNQRNPMMMGDPRMGQGSPCSFRGSYRGMAACVIDTIVTAADALATGPSGRKTLVYISTGVPYNFAMDNPEASDDLHGIQHMFATLQQANVNVYAIDPSGLTQDGIMAPRLDALRVFAETTGGHATIATNAPWDAVPQIFRENSSYYLLGFRPANPVGDGQFRRVEVKVDRPGVQVLSRNGYYAPRPDTGKGKGPRPAPERTPAEKALASGLPGGDLPFFVSAVPIAGSDRSHPAVVVVAGFHSLPVSATQKVDLVASAIDADAKIRGTVHQTVEVEPRRPGGAESAYDVVSRLPIQPGHYQIRVGATGNGETGSVFSDVDVPDFTKSPLSLSGLILGLDDRSASRSSNPLTDLVPLVPTTSREFPATAMVTAFVRIYQGGGKPPGAVRVTATITDEHNRTTFDQTEFLESARFAGGRAADHSIVLPLSTLEAGPYLLTIQAGLGKTTIRRDARFTVR
jgi:VWFA-related protein